MAEEKKSPPPSAESFATADCNSSTISTSSTPPDEVVATGTLAAAEAKREKEGLAEGKAGTLAGAGDGRTFSQLLAGAMGSPAGSPRTAGQLVAVPVVAVPCIIAPTGLLESPRFTGQFAMTHQAVLATVTAQAQMQLQAAYPSSSSELLTNPFPKPMVSPISPTPLQRMPPSLPEDNICTPQAEQRPSSDQKPQSARIVVKATSSDGYNWRKYGQKQVKSSDRSRSYYKCTDTSCSAKKKVEFCQDGRVTEIIYRGLHNHDPPQKTRCSKERGSQSGGLSGLDENVDPPSKESNEPDPSTSKMVQNSANDTPEQLHCSSDCEEEEAGVKSEEDTPDEPDPKRRLSEIIVPQSASPLLKTIREPKIVVQTASDAGLVTDGYRWRKYGQKIVKGNPNPRSYYRCTHTGCPVRKHVERASEDAKAIVITYEGKHNHDQPPPKNGSDPSASAALIAAADAVAVTSGRETQYSDVFVEQKPSPEQIQKVEQEMTGKKALELGGEKVLESAETLLSIGNSTSGEANGETNSDSIQQPIFNENHAAVPVQNS